MDRSTDSTRRIAPDPDGRSVHTGSLELVKIGVPGVDRSQYLRCTRDRAGSNDIERHRTVFPGHVASKYLPKGGKEPSLKIPQSGTIGASAFKITFSLGSLELFEVFWSLKSTVDLVMRSFL